MIPEIQFYQQGAKVRLVMGTATTTISRVELRSVLVSLGLGIPGWLYPDRDPKS